MIKIVKNLSFPEWSDIFAFGEFVDQVKGRAKALRIATKIAKENGKDLIVVDDKIVEID
tara:strand:+ start:538 stop:714 length:177 start_codon:yes stop_codon:yes gene_type:complete